MLDLDVLRRSSLLASAALALTLFACDGGEGEHGGGHGEGHAESHLGRIPAAAPEKPMIDVDKLRKQALKQFAVLPESFPSAQNPGTKAKVDLGRMLYYDGRLSVNGEISCNSCHVLSEYGVDSLPTSPGHEGKNGDRNSPTVFNAAGHLAQFWDGREPTVEAQAKGPILNPIEMGMPDEATVVAVLNAIPGYVDAFQKAFPDAAEGEAVSYDNMANAIGAFERNLVTPGPIDKWLAGDDAALSAEATAGLQLFMDSKCTDCHTGTNFGGANYQKLGVEKPWPGLEDVGRFAVTKDERDRNVFKVPSLRNIDKTGPYLHDGSITSLEDMVSKMVEYQVPREALSEEEMANMLAFLGSLTGELPSAYIAKPDLPEGDVAGVVGGTGGDEADADADAAEDAPAEAEPKPAPKPVEAPADGGE